MLYYRKMLRIEKEKTQNLLLRLERSKTKKVNEVDSLEKEVKKIMRQTGLSYDLALQIYNGKDNIKVKTSHNKIKKPTKLKY